MKKMIRYFTIKINENLTKKNEEAELEIFSLKEKLENFNEFEEKNKNQLCKINELSKKISEIYFENSNLQEKVSQIEVLKKELQNNQELKLKHKILATEIFVLKNETAVSDKISDNMMDIEEKKYNVNIESLKTKNKDEIDALKNAHKSVTKDLNNKIYILKDSEKNYKNQISIFENQSSKLNKHKKKDIKTAIVRGKPIDQNLELIKRYSKILKEKVDKNVSLDHFEHLILQYRYLPNVKKIERTLNSYDRKSFEAALPNSITKDDWRSIQNEFDNKCALSGILEDISFEHFIPISTGHGGTHSGNIIPLNKSLNLSKNNRNPFYWFSKNDFPVNFSIDSWDNLINILAKKNKLSVDQYVSFVNWCFEFPRTLEQIKEDGDINSIDLWKKSLLKTNERVAVAG